MGKMILRFLFACGCLVALYVVFRCISSWRQGYAWKEMDWSQRGCTTLGDFFLASEIGKRTIDKGSGACIEYYAYKDGSTVKIVCPQK